MTIQANYYWVGSMGNGATTTFGIPWPFRDPTDVVVQLLVGGVPVTPPPVLNGGGTYDYHITGTPDPDTGFYGSGNIVFNTAPLGTQEVLITRATKDWQDKSLPTNGRFPAKSVEAALDRRTLVDQEQDFALGNASTVGGNNGRYVKMSPYDQSAFDPTLPSTQGAGGQLLGEKADGSGFQWYNFSGGPILGITGTPLQINVSPLTPAGQYVISLSPGVYLQANVPWGTGNFMQFTYQNTAPTGVMRFTAVNDLGHTGALQVLGSTYVTSFPAMPADSAIFYTDCANGMSVGTNQNAPLRFVIGLNEVARFDTNGFLGIGNTAPTRAIDIVQSVNGSVNVALRNNSTGNNAITALYAANNAGQNIQIGMYGTGVSFGPLAVITTTSPQGLLLQTVASAPLIFQVGGGETARFDTSGRLSIGGTGQINAQLDLTENVAGPLSIWVNNLNAAGSAVLRLTNNQSNATLDVTCFGTGYTASGLYKPQQGAFVCYGANGMIFNNLAGAPIIFAVANAEMGRFDAGGNFCLKATAAAAVFTIGDSNTGAYGMRINNSNAASWINWRTDVNLGTTAYHAYVCNPNGIVGGCVTNGSTTSWLTSSDLRLKKNVKPAGDAGAIIDQIEIMEFDWKSDDRHVSHGIIAQQLHKICPDAAFEPEEKNPLTLRPWMYDPSKLVPLLVAEVQHLRRRLEKMERAA